jgi:hypothetical protein
MTTKSEQRRSSFLFMLFSTRARCSGSHDAAPAPGNAAGMLPCSIVSMLDFSSWVTGKPVFEMSLFMAAGPNDTKQCSAKRDDEKRSCKERQKRCLATGRSSDIYVQPPQTTVARIHMSSGPRDSGRHVLMHLSSHVP